MIQTDLREFVQQTGPLKVDADKAVIEGCRVLGLESANGRTYLREGVADALRRGVYEGQVTNVDHPTKPGETTRVESRNGWLENCRQESDGGIRGDWHLLKSHPLTPMILEVAQRRPQLLGLSHNAVGKTRREGGREIVESIDKVHSVDCVADPATVKGFHESRNTIMKSTVKTLIESFKKTRPGFSRALKEMAEAGLMSPDSEMDVPAEASKNAPEEVVDTVDHEQAILDAAKACIDDSSLDSAGKIAKIKKLLGMLDMAEGPAGSGEPVDNADDKKDEGPAGMSGSDEIRGKNKDGQRRAMWAKDPVGDHYESKKAADANLREELLKLKAKDTLRTAADEANVKIPAVMLEAVSPTITPAQAKALAESLKGTQPAQGARSAPAWTPAKTADGKTIQEQKQQSTQLEDTPEARAQRIAAFRAAG